MSTEKEMETMNRIIRAMAMESKLTPFITESNPNNGTFLEKTSTMPDDISLRGRSNRG